MSESKPDPAAAPMTSAEAMFWSDRPRPALSSRSEELPANTSPAPSYTFDDPDELQPQASRGGLGLVVIGSIALVLGVGVSTCSYDAAVARGGGEYFVCTGAIAYGLVAIVRGLFR
jgi:hypothetical protein